MEPNPNHTIDEHFVELVRFMFKQDTSRIKISLELDNPDTSKKVPVELGLVLLEVDGVKTDEGEILGVI